MKKSKIIILFLLMLISIFKITNVKALEKNIKVTDISVKDKSTSITVVDPVITNNNITSNITFNEVDDFVMFNLKIKNNEKYKYKIESIKDNNTNTNIKIEYNYDEDYIKANGTTIVTIKLTYKNKLINVEKININDLVLTITLSNEDENTSTITINNPKTSDSILKYLILLIISITGLIFIKKKVKYNRIKLGSILILLAIVLLPFTIFAKEKYELNIIFKDIVVMGEFEKYNITINPQNGDTPTIKEVTYGNTVGELPIPNKEGYTFEKWLDNNGNEVTEDTVITESIEINAKYNINEYTINYVLNGGTVSNNPSKYTVETSDITLNNPSKEGYTFTGWTEGNSNILNKNIIIEKGSVGNKIYTAHYTINTYSVTFMNEGNVYSTKNVNYNTRVSKPSNPVKEAYSFLGWYEDEDLTKEYDFNTLVTNNIVLYAKYRDLCKTFSTDSWTDIVNNLKNDSEYYSGTYGCEKEVELDMDNDGENESYTVRLVNTSTPDNCSTSGFSQTACGTVIEFKDIVTKMMYSSPASNEGGWANSTIVTYLNGEFYNKLPSDLKSVIIPTYPIVSGSGSGGVSPDITSSDTSKNKVYLLATKEMAFNASEDNKSNMTRPLDFYSKLSSTNNYTANAGSFIRKKTDLNDIVVNAWFRTAIKDNNYAYYNTSNTGTIIGTYAHSSLGIAPAFRIGIND